MINVAKSRIAIYISIISIIMVISYLSGIFSERYLINTSETIKISDIKLREPIPDNSRKNLQGKKAVDNIYPSAPRNWKLKGEVRRLSLNSVILGRKLLFNVYLPEDYQRKVSEGKSFPTCYFFHGGDKGYLDNWVTDRRGVASAHAELTEDFLSSLGSTIDLILVSPDRAKVGYFHNEGRSKWGDVICNELIPYIDGNFASNKVRMVTGLCNGGHSAWRIAIQRPELFDYVGSSSGFFPRMQTRENIEILRTFRGIFFDVGTGEDMYGSCLKMERYLASNNIRFKHVFLKGYGHNFRTWGGHPNRILPKFFRKTIQ
ncbi:MAG: hypothetical protein JXA60_02635 [Candidatus Coatesbacteria bacterium]|nr:hypothetical protein [Candidatus Coatesbacteria bacterium]